MHASSSSFFARLALCLCLFLCLLPLPGGRRVAWAIAIDPYNASFWAQPSATFRGAAGEGHHTRCAFGTNVVERFIAATLSANRPSLGTARAPLAPFIFNLPDPDGGDSEGVVAFDGCASAFGYSSAVLDEAAPGGAQNPRAVACTDALVPTPAERSLMFAAVAAAAERLRALVRDVPFDARSTPIVLQPADHACRLSDAFPRALAFRHRSHNLAIIVSAVPLPQNNRDGESFWRDVLAWGVPCAYDAEGRPLVVRINFGVLKLRRMVAANQTDHIVADAFHQLLHGAGFGGPRSGAPQEATVLGKPSVPYWAGAPQSFMRSQYACDDGGNTRFFFDDALLTPQRLRPSVGYVSHFEPRIVARDVMASGRGAFTHLSAASLAYLAASCPFYALKVNHTAVTDPQRPVRLAVSLPAALAEWRGAAFSAASAETRRSVSSIGAAPLRLFTALPTATAGCGIHDTYCDSPRGGTGTVFCRPTPPSALPEDSLACRRDRVGLTGCQVRAYTVPTPFATPFGVAPDGSGRVLGGFSPESDYCAYPNGTDGGLRAEEEMHAPCTTPTPLLPERSGSSFGPSSRCYASDVMRSTSRRIPFDARCFTTRCYWGVMVQLMVSALDGDAFVSCPRDGSAGFITVGLPTHSGTVECPSYTTACVPALRYEPFPPSFSGVVANASGYPFELAVLPPSEAFTRLQAEAICAGFGATLMTAADWRVLNTAGGHSQGAWVQFRSIFGIPATVAPPVPHGDCVVVRSHQIAAVDCATAVSGIGCVRRPPAAATAPCPPGRPCLLSHTNPSLSSVFVVPAGAQRVSATAAGGVCAAYGAVPFIIDVDSVAEALVSLRALFGNTPSPIVGLWTGFGSAAFVGRGELLRLGVADVGCVVMAQQSLGAPFTLHVTDCNAEFEVLCVVRDPLTPPTAAPAAVAADDVPTSVFIASVPRTYDGAAAYCASGGGVLAPFFSAADLSLRDKWLAGASSKLMPVAADVLSSPPQRAATEGLIFRRFWAGLKPFGSTGAFGGATLYPNITAGRFVPSAADIASAALPSPPAERDAVLREVPHNTANAIAAWRAVPSSGGGGVGGGQPSGPFVDTMAVAYFACAFTPPPPPIRPPNVPATAAGEGVAAAISFAAFTAPLPFDGAVPQCSGASLQGPLITVSSLLQPRAGDTFGAPLSSVSDVLRTYIAAVERSFVADAAPTMALGTQWTGLLYLPAEDILASAEEGGGAVPSQFIRLTPADMAALRAASLLPPAAALADHSGGANSAFLCVHLQLRGAATRLGTAPCAVPLPIVCASIAAPYGPFAPVRAPPSQGQSQTPLLGVDAEFLNVQCSYSGRGESHGEAVRLCGLVGGALLQPPLVPNTTGPAVFTAMDLFAARAGSGAEMFPDGVRLWTNLSQVVNGTGAKGAPSARYASSPAPFFMSNFSSSWLTGPAAGEPMCYTIQYEAPSVVGGPRVHTVEQRPCAEANPFVCCVNAPRALVTLLTPAVREGTLVVNVTVPRRANAMAGASIGATLRLRPQHEQRAAVVVPPAPTAPMPLVVGASVYWAAVAVPTARGQSCGADECPPLQWNGTHLVTHREEDYSITFDLASPQTAGIGVDLTRLEGQQGATVSLLRCPSAALESSSAALCGVPTNVSQTVTVALVSSGPPQPVVVSLFLSTKAGGCDAEEPALGTVLFSDGATTTRTVTTPGGVARTNLTVSVTVFFPVYGATLCARLSAASTAIDTTNSDGIGCGCCKSFALSPLSAYVAEGTNLFTLVPPPNGTATDFGAATALRNVGLLFPPSLWRFYPHAIPPTASIAIEATDDASGAPADFIAVVPASAALSTITDTRFTMTGLGPGNATLTARVGAVSSVAPYGSGACAALPPSNASGFAPLAPGGAYGIAGGRVAFRPVVALSAALIDAFGRPRTLYYAAEPMTLRITVRTSMGRAALRAHLVAVGIDVVQLRVLSGARLATLREGQPLVVSRDVPQALLGLPDGAPLQIDIPLRAVNATRLISGVPTDGIFSEAIAGGLALASAPNNDAQSVVAAMSFGGIRWLLDGTTPNRLADVALVQRSAISASPYPTRLILGGLSAFLNFSIPQAPATDASVTVGCDRFIAPRTAQWAAGDFADVTAGALLTRTVEMASASSAGAEAVAAGGYTAARLQCYVHYFVGFEISASNATFAIDAYPQVAATVSVSDATLLAGTSVTLNVSLPLPSDPFYDAAQIGVTVGSNASLGLVVTLLESTARQQQRRYTYRVSALPTAPPATWVCLAITPLNATITALVPPRCFFIAPPIRVTVAPLPSFSQPVGEERAVSIVVSVNSLPLGGPVEATLSCLVPLDSMNRTVATFVPSVVRWEPASAAAPGGGGGQQDAILQRNVAFTGRQPNTQCFVMVTVSGGSEVQNLGPQAPYGQSVLFIASEVVTVVPAHPFTQLFPGPRNVRRLVVAISRQPSAPLTVAIVTDAPPGMVYVTPPTVSFLNVSTENRTREVFLSSAYGAGDGVGSSYNVWAQLRSAPPEFVQRGPSDGIANTFVPFESTRLYNISVVSPSAPARGHITDTAVYCGDAASATSLIFRSPHAPIEVTDRAFLTLIGGAGGQQTPPVRLYTIPAVTIFTQESPLERPFLLACDESSFPADVKTLMLPISIGLDAPGEFGAEGIFYAEVRRLETFTVTADAVATVSSSRIYLDVALSAPVAVGKELRLALVTSCGGALALFGDAVMAFAPGEQQRSTRLVALGAAPEGCNITMVQTADSKATNFVQFSPTRRVTVYPQARVLAEGEVAPENDADLPLFLAARRANAFTIPQLKARDGFGVVFRVEHATVSAAPLRIDRMATGISPTTSVAVTSSDASSEYLRTVMGGRAASVVALSSFEGGPLTRFEVRFGAIATPTSVPQLTHDEAITLVFSRYLFARNDSAPATGFGNYTFYITPEEVSIAGVQRSAVSAAAIVATVLSPFSGPSLAPHFSRVAVLIGMGDCPAVGWRSKKQYSIDLFTYPIQADAVGAQSAMGGYLMAVIMDLVFVLILIAGHCMLVAMIFAARINVVSSSRSLVPAMQKARFPGASIFALGYFAGLVTEYGFRTVVYSDDALYICLAAFFMAVFFVATAYSFYHVHSRPFSTYEALTAEEAEGPWYRRFLQARGVWVPRVEAAAQAQTASDREKVLCFTDRYGSMFTQYVAQWRYYFAIDVGFSIVIGFIGVFEPDSSAGCLAKSSVLCATFTASALVLAYMRPYTHHVYNAFFLCISACEVVSIALSVAAASSSSGTFGVRAANISMLVVTNMLLIKLAVDLGMLVVGFVAGRLAKRHQSREVATVGRETGLVPYTDFASAAWWGDHFGDDASQRLAPLLPDGTSPRGGGHSFHEMMCNLDRDPSGFGAARTNVFVPPAAAVSPPPESDPTL